MHYALVLLALGALLALHELGHLVAARLMGVRVPRFVFGFGPPLVSFRLWGTQYVVAAVPLGATAHIQGMNPHRADAAEAASFGTLGPLKRLLIILAGPLANYVLALGLLVALYMSGTHVVVPLTVGTVQPGSEAARAQLLPGDRILRVDGQPPRGWSEFVEKVARAPGRPLELAVERHGESRTVMVRPRPDERGEGRIGVSQQYVYRAHGASEALGHALAHTGSVASEGLGMLVGVVHGPERSGTAGPGALMRQESSDAASFGWDSLLRALVAASVALALLTMLPVPGLDGGRVMLLLVEAASGRRLPARVETVAQTVGFLAIAAAILTLAGAEIRRALPERLAPASPGTQALAPGTAAQRPAGAGTQPPAAVGAQPPAIAGAEAGTQPPAAAGTQPPAAAGAQPPVTVGAELPAAEGAQPPAAASAQPSATVGSEVSAAAGAQPPAVASAQSPATSGTQLSAGAAPAAITGTQPPTAGGTQAPPVAGSPLPAAASSQPAATASTQLPAAGGTQPPTGTQAVTGAPAPAASGASAPAQVIAPAAGASAQAKPPPVAAGTPAPAPAGAAAQQTAPAPAGAPAKPPAPATTAAPPP